SRRSFSLARSEELAPVSCRSRCSPLYRSRISAAPASGATPSTSYGVCCSYQSNPSRISGMSIPSPRLAATPQRSAGLRFAQRQALRWRVAAKRPPSPQSPPQRLQLVAVVPDRVVVLADGPAELRDRVLVLAEGGEVRRHLAGLVDVLPGLVQV